MGNPSRWPVLLLPGVLIFSEGIGNSSVDITNLKLPVAPKKAAICALNDVLAASIQNGK
jgi:hypothetical protein